MEIGSVADLLGELKQLQLLEESQIEDVHRNLQGSVREPRALAAQLLKRGWLTPFQVNTLFQGRGDELVLGSYLLLERQGEGVMGQVYKARHRRMRRMVSLVVVCEELLATPGAVDRFYGEIQAASQLSHPNIVNCFDAGPVGQTHFVATEYVDGVDLEGQVRVAGPMRVELACDFVSQAAQGLHHAWQRGLLHHDLRPANLVATRPGAAREAADDDGSTLRTQGRTLIKVRNLGLTFLRHTAGPKTRKLEAAPASGEYLSPEQVRDPLVTDVRSDVYSLGACLYFLLTGQPPTVQGNRPPAQRFRPEVPVELDGLIDQLLAPDPNHRLQTPEELVAALAPWVQSPRAAPTLDLALAVQTNLAPPLPTPAHEPAPNPPSLIVRAASSVVRQFARPGSKSGASSTSARRPRKPRRWLALTAVAGSVLLLVGGLFATAAWLSGGTGSRKAQEVKAQGELDRLGPLPADAAAQLEYLQKLLVFRQTYPGTPAALQAAQMFAAIPGPLGELDESGISRSESAALPPDVVGVLGSREHGGNGGQVLSVNWTHNLVVVREPEASLSVKNLLTGERLKVFSNDDAPNTWQAQLAPDGKTVALIGGERTVRVFNLSSPTNTPTMVLSAHPEGSPPNTMIAWVAYSPNSSLLATVTSDNTVRFTEIVLQGQGPAGGPPAPAKEKFQLRPANGAAVWPIHAAFSPDGQYFGVASGDNVVRVYDLAKQTEKWAAPMQPTIPGRFFQPWCLAFSPEPGSLTVLLGDRSARVLELETGNPRSNFNVSPLENTPGAFLLLPMHYPRNQAMDLTPVQYSPDGKSLVMLGFEHGSNRGKILTWSLEENKEIKQISAPGAMQGYQYLSPMKEGAPFYSLYSDLSYHLWDLKGGKELCLLKSALDVVAVGAISPTGRSVSTGSQDGRVVVWEQDKTGMKAQRTLRGHSLAVSGLAYAPDGQSLATTSYDRTLRFWDLSRRDGERLKVSSPTMLTALAYAPDGKSVAAAGADGKVTIWEVANGAVRLTFDGMTGWVQALAYSPDGQTLAAAGDDGNIRLWGLGKAHERGQCAMTKAVGALAFAPDGKSLVAGLSGPNDAPYLRTATGAETNFKPTNASLPAVHSKGVRGLAFSPDGKLLASVGDDSQLVVWKTTTWDAKKYLLANPIRGVSFAPDGRHLLTVNRNGTCYIFRLPSEEH